MAEQLFPWTHIIRFPENRGFCAAINEGITRARTPYVFLLNNDTTVDPACIRRLERRMDNDPRLFSAAAKMLSMKNPDIMDGAGDRYNALGWAFAIGKGRPSTDYNTPMPIFSASAGAALYRKEYLQKTGLLDELHFAYLEDVDLGYRARILGYRNAYEPTAKVYHAGSATTGSRYNPFKITHSSRNNIYLIYKNMPLFQLILNLPFLIAGFFIKTLFFCAKGYAGLAGAVENTVWTKHKSGIMSEHIWAPELHYLDGKWYLYFAAGEAEDIWAIRPFVLECADEDPITGKWTELGMMQCAEEDEFSFRAFSLDATVFENKGSRYYVWAEKVGVGKMISNLYIARMASPNRLETVQVLLTTPDYDWERVDFWVNEGPAVIKRNGRIFLTYSASATGACYCMGMLSASEEADLLDLASWTKERRPVLASEESLGIYGPGHNSFTTDEEGNDICVYHARKEAVIEGDPLYNPNRHTMLMKVRWSEDGKPVFSYR